jgi:hypothetical protein
MQGELDAGFEGFIECADAVAREDQDTCRAWSAMWDTGWPPTNLGLDVWIVWLAQPNKPMPLSLCKQPIYIAMVWLDRLVGLCGGVVYGEGNSLH